MKLSPPPSRIRHCQGQSSTSRPSGASDSRQQPDSDSPFKTRARLADCRSSSNYPTVIFRFSPPPNTSVHDQEKSSEHLRPRPGEILPNTSVHDQEKSCRTPPSPTRRNPAEHLRPRPGEIPPRPAEILLTTMASRTSTVTALKNRLTQIYEEYKPEQIPKIDYLLKKYENEEQLLYKSVCEKYDLSGGSYLSDGQQEHNA